MSDRVPSSTPPPPLFGTPPPPHATESHFTVAAADGTRLFVRTMPAAHADERLPVSLVFCDGILCDGFVWKYLWTDLAERCDVAHWHYRGHGRSGAPVDEHRIDIAAHAADLARVRQSLGDPPCILIGHSMGTQVTLEHFHRYPKNVKGLILICGSYGKVTQSFRGVPILDMVLSRLMGVVDKQPEIARAVWSRIPPEMALKAALLARDVDPDKIRREDLMPYLKHMTHVDFSMFLRMLRAAGDHSAEAWLGEVNVPVLVIAGEKDTFTPPSLSEWMASRIPNAELLMVAGGSHVAPLEQPALVRERITAFIERVAAT